MSNSEHKSKLIIGDDGELLEADTQVDMAVYYDSIADPFPPPTLLERFLYFVSNSPLVWIIFLIFISAMVIFLWISPVREIPEHKPLEWTNYIILSTPIPAIPTSSVSHSQPVGTFSIFKLLGVNVNTTDRAKLLKNIIQIRWSPDGHYLALQFGTDLISIWDVEKKQFVYSGTQSQPMFDWSSDGQYLYGILHQNNNQSSPLLTRVAISSVPQSANLISIAQPSLLVTALPLDLTVSSRNQIALLAGDGLSFTIVNPDRSNDFMTRKLDTAASDIDWAANGRWLSVLTTTGIWEWNTTGEGYAIVSGHYQHLSWSPDGTEIAVTQDIIQDGLHQPRIAIINLGLKVQEWTQPILPGRKSMNDPDNFNVQVAWSPGGRHIATFIQNDTAVDLWDAKTGNLLLRSYNDTAINDLDWSPDGKHLAIGGNTGVTIWSPE